MNCFNRGVFVVLMAVRATCLYGQGHEPLKLAKHIGLTGVEGRIDHFSVDVKGNRLFMSALGNRTLEVLDIGSGKRLHTITDLAQPQGVYYDPSSNRIFVASAGDGSTRIFDGSSYAPVATVNFSGNADNVRYDTHGRRIIVGYGNGALAFLDPAGKNTGEIALENHPESFQIEKNGNRVFVNVPNNKEIQIADLSTNKVIGKWPVTSASKNFPMALDEARHRLFTGCRTPAQLLVLDTDSGATKASVDIVGDTDDLFYDAEKRRIYVIGGEGFVDVLEQKDDDRYNRMARYPTASGARTGLFVASLGKLFVAVPHRGDQRAEILVYDTN
jgi:DNA-binding beta-propeller fold protein YncE